MASRQYQISMSRVLAADAGAAYDIVCHPERFPEFMPNVESVQIIEATPTRKRAEWRTLIDDAPLEWIEEGIYDHSQRLVRFRATDGVFDKFDGVWQVVDADGGCRVTFELVYEIGLPEIEEIVGPMLRDKLIENADGMLAAVEKRVGRL